MGKEYRIHCQKFNIKSAKEFLERRFTVTATTDGYFSISLSTTSAEQSNIAPVIIGLEPDGVYFLNNLSAPDQAAIIFMQLIEFLLSTADEISIIEP